MRPTLLLLALTTAALAAEPANGLKAAKAIPKTMSKSFAGLSARGGAPVPEKWLVLVHDSKAPSGVREFTVTGGVVVSTKEGSDYAPAIAAENRIDSTKVRVDSDLASELVAAYAASNNSVPAAFDFDLRQNGEGASPLWTVAALDVSGARLGTVVIAANTGAVISHDGFANEPSPADLTTEIGPQKDSDTKGTASTKKSSSSSSDDGKRPGTFHRVGGHLQKFFTGRNTIGK
jgi:hypothetical protein